jgi:CheY-like chemotaxis protein
MDRDKLQKFVSSAAADIAAVRSALLIAGQSGEADLNSSAQSLKRIREEAFGNMQPALAVTAADCESALANVSGGDLSPSAIGATLDKIAAIEAALLNIPLRSEDFLTDVGSFVENSFDQIIPHSQAAPTEPKYKPQQPVVEAFEIDEESLEIFREEAHDLLINIDANLRALADGPGDQNALWEIRRNAHTFKGAAGIVGLTEAAALAHRMEDLLDKMVELRREAAPEVMEFLNGAAIELNSMVRLGQSFVDHDDESYALALARLDVTTELSPPPTLSAAPAEETRSDPVKEPSGPVVRVSLDRLDELLKICNSLVVNRSALAERFAEMGLNGNGAKLCELIEIGRRLTGEMQQKLTQIRMVKFGTLETRLARAVNVTCMDEGKKAVLELENAETEIDTRHIDALIEPLLHLLKNAVVHGIETPDTRRLIGKPEKGTVRVRIDANDSALILTISDDGAGIAISKLRQKVGADAATPDADVLRSIFDRGLTTAEKLDMNAGRGVGLSIVKEAIESRGGSVMVDSKPQGGTTFTVLLPLHAPRTEPEEENSAVEEPGTDVIDTTPLVMIVDDSSSIRRHLARLVEDSGFRVITANNGAEALELLLNNKEPDLILTDVEMPHLDGWQLLEYVKSDDNFGHIPVVMVTSLDADEYRERAFSLGAIDYIVKPFGGRDVERALSVIRVPIVA